MESDAIREYGGALFELAREEGAEDAILSDVRGVKPFFERGSDFVRLLDCPNITHRERNDVIKRAFYGRINEYLLNFICLMTDRGYAGSIYGALDKFIELYNVDHAIADAYVVSAVELTQAQRSALASALAARTGKKVNLICRVDPSVIGGISVCIDGEEFDGTITHKISQIRRKLNELSVN